MTKMKVSNGNSEKNMALPQDDDNIEDKIEEESIKNEIQHETESKKMKVPITSVLVSHDIEIEPYSPAARAIEATRKQTKSSGAKQAEKKSSKEAVEQEKETNVENERDKINIDREEEIMLRDKKGKRVSLEFLKTLRSLRLSTVKKNENVKGNVIDKEHELYILSISMMIGLRYSIYKTHVCLKENRENDKQEWLSTNEFMETEKFVFSPNGRNADIPPHSLGQTFKFKSYAPIAFAYIRRMFGINKYSFIDSICANHSFIDFISNSKSGSFFFYSSDGKYMIKTMSNTESKFLRRSK